MTAKQIEKPVEAPAVSLPAGVNLSVDVVTALLEELKSLRADVAALQAVTAKMPPTVKGRIARKDRPPDGGAWLVTTPNDEYAGKTCGIQFQGGIGIVDVERPNAEPIVHKLEHDFGYTVQPVGPDELNQVRKTQAMAEARAKSLVEKLMK